MGPINFFWFIVDNEIVIKVNVSSIGYGLPSYHGQRFKYILNFCFGFYELVYINFCQTL